jgi:hypothetical protein
MLAATAIGKRRAMVPSGNAAKAADTNLAPHPPRSAKGRIGAKE